MTPEPQETLEEVAERVVNENLDTDHYSASRRDLTDATIGALRERDQRAARIIKEHRQSDVCKENCWTTIINQILGVLGKER